jgi:hypothetical protein
MYIRKSKIQYKYQLVNRFFGEFKSKKQQNSAKKIMVDMAF